MKNMVVNYKALLEESLKFLPSNLRSLLSVLEVYTNEANLSSMNEEQVRDALNVIDACRYSTMALELFIHKLASMKLVVGRDDPVDIGQPNPEMTGDGAMVETVVVDLEDNENFIV